MLFSSLKNLFTIFLSHTKNTMFSLIFLFFNKQILYLIQLLIVQNIPDYQKYGLTRCIYKRPSE